MKQSSWLAGLCAAVLLLGSAAPVLAAPAADTTDTTADITETMVTDTTETAGTGLLAEPIALVTEPGEIGNKVYYYDGAKKVQPEDFTWVPGKTGLAVQLNGSTQYLRYSSAQTLKLESFTFAAWVNWQGGEAADQRLLTVYRNENRFITLSLNRQDEAAGIHGLCAEWQDRSIEPITLFSQTNGITTTAPESGVWHHVAVTVAPTAFTVYVDGTALYQADMSAQPVDLAAMRLNTFAVGRGIEGEPTLNALLDDAYLYPQALTDNEVALLAAGLNPADGGTPPTATTYLATRPRTTTVAGSVSAGEKNTLFGVPVMLVVIPAAVIVAAVVLSLVFSAQKRHASVPDGEEFPTILAGMAVEPEAEPEPETDEEKEGDAE